MNSVPRDLYLDLLLKSVSNLIYGPLPPDPWNDGLFRRDARPGRDRNSPAHSMLGVLRLENVRKLAQRAIDETIPGDFIETGVWRGGCCILMRGMLAANGVHDRKVYVADSFSGVPAPKPDIFPADANDAFHEISGLAVSLEQVRENFERYGLLDDQVVFVKGPFSETLPCLDAGPFALIRLDAYESTYVALEHLYPKLSVGGFALIDDYGGIEPCRRAVMDYRARMAIDEETVQVDWTGIWWQKTR